MSQFSVPTHAPESPGGSTGASSRRSRKGALIAGSLIAVVLLGAGAGAATASRYYASRALPGTTISGQDVSGMTEAEVTEFVSSRTKDFGFTFQVAGETVAASSRDIGLSFDVSQTVDAALAPSHSFSSQVSSFFSGPSVEPVVVLDEATLTSFAKDLALKAGPVVEQASVKALGNGEFATTPAVVGKAVDFDKLKAAVLSNAASLASTPVQAEVSDVEPTITDADAEALVAQAKALLTREVKVTDGIDVFAPDVETRSSWVVIPESTDGVHLEAPRYDKDKVKQWVEKTAKDSNVEALPTYNNVDASGKILVEGAKPGRKGYTVNNADKILDGILAAGQKGEAFDGEFTYDEITPPVENRQVLPGAEKLAYPAAAGEKWLEINLGSNSVSAYIGADRVRGPIPIVPGSPGHETVTGLFHIYLKYDKQDMGCTPEWPYCAKDVPWVSYFHGSYAFHGAPWQESFGWSGEGGSHGCVNMPVPEAHWLHQWADMGTPVASHY